jgi:hypothetical protein
LFRILPCVLFVKTRNADIPSNKQAIMDTNVEICVTVAKRSSVGVFKLPYISRELWWHTNAKLITPIAWKIPGLMTEKRWDGSPFKSGETCWPSKTTDVTIMSMPISAKADALESLWMSRYKDRGYEIPSVHRAIIH